MLLTFSSALLRVAAAPVRSVSDSINTGASTDCSAMEATARPSSSSLLGSVGTTMVRSTDETANGDASWRREIEVLEVM